MDLSVDQIDTELPLDEQLEDSKRTAEGIWTFVKSQIDSQIDEVLDENG